MIRRACTGWGYQEGRLDLFYIENMAKQKYYAVWRSVEWYIWAQYKSFSSHEEAKVALRRSASDYIGNAVKPSWPSESEKKKYGEPIMESISVDGAWNTVSWWCEYQGVMTDTGDKIFHELVLPIYKDSQTAISWVKAKNARTKLPRNAQNIPLFILLDTAVLWLKSNTYKNPILKWETKVWGEIKADFGRK